MHSKTYINNTVCNDRLSVLMAQYDGVLPSGMCRVEHHGFEPRLDLLV